MLCKWAEDRKEALYVVMRIVVGLLFLAHGLGKFGVGSEMNIAGFAGMFGTPVWLATIVALIELVGGLGIALGLFTRLWATLNGIIMIVAWFMAHIPNGWNPLTNGGELALLYLVVFIVMKGHGNGPLSLEGAMLKKEVF